MKKALYRLFRPKTFEEVVGQDHIVRTLKNQISQNDIGHAYLFSGSRGTGKTSAAKIFSRAVNCINPNGANPCNECEVCRGALLEGESDIVEIDAASNNGVEDIRELRDKVNYPPVHGKYRVYIIDEVHMLSTAAFNAFLKTLEEPPSHVIFILATTEPHKIPKTILSRCQRFDFKRITKEDIQGRLLEVCTSLEVESDPRALNFIAKNSEGAMRDALSILDQAISSKKGEILSYEDVIDLMGSVPIKNLSDMAEGLIYKKTSKCLEVLEEISLWGKDFKQFLSELIEYFRDLLLLSMQAPSNLLGIEGEELESAIEILKDTKSHKLSDLLEELSLLEGSLKYASNPKLSFEIGVFRLTRGLDTNNTSCDMSELEKRLQKLETIIESGEISVKRDSSVPREIAGQEKVEKKQEKINLEEDMNEDEKNIVEEAKKFYPEVAERMKKDKKANVEAFLREGEILRYFGSVLYIAYDDKNFGFHKQMIDSQKNRDYISEIYSKVLKLNLRVVFLFKSEVSKIAKKPEEEEVVEKIKEAFPDIDIEVRE